MEITAALPADAAELTAIAHAAKRHWNYPEAWIAEWKMSLTLTPAYIAQNETMIARVDGMAVGFYAFVKDAGVLRLDHLWVSPAKMRCGCGTALFRHAQERALSAGFAEFAVEADSHAVGFYERMRAELIGTTVTFVEGQRRELPVLSCPTTPNASQHVSSS